MNVQKQVQNTKMESKRHNLLHLLVILLTATSAAPAATPKEHCHPQDKRALLAIQQSLFGNRTHNTWLPDTDCCRVWDGVKCDRLTHRVTTVSIYGADGFPSAVMGPIPDAVGDLPGLTSLRLHKLANLTGGVPHSLVRLQSLVGVDLSWNSLSGPVPGFFRRMRSLRFIDLSFNEFSGEIPPELALGPALFAIDLSRNRLTGSIPSGFGSFRNTGVSLSLSHNRLSGTLPKSLANVQFSTVDFSRNQLVGDATVVFENGSSLQTVVLSRNGFSFNLTDVVMPSGLITLDISHNEIFGSLPAGLSNLRMLQFLNASYNRLCGEIPKDGGKSIFGGMSTFDNTSYVHNKCLCGTPLPACK